MSNQEALKKLAAAKALIAEAEAEISAPPTNPPVVVPPSPQPPNQHDDNHSALVYIGEWKASPGDAKFGGSDHYSNVAGASLAVQFTGTRIVLYGAQASHHGTAKVVVDSAVKTVTQKSAERVDSIAFFDSGDLPNGVHNLALTIVGDGVISLDKVDVYGSLNAGQPQPPVTTPPTNLLPITRKGNKLFRGSEPWWFVGYNSFVWSANCGNSNEKMSTAQVEKWFESMRHDGHGLVRLFFFAGWDWSRLDHAIAQAKKHNIYLIITVDDAIAGCGESKKDGGWFNNASEKATYRDHFTKLLTKYKGEPIILAFEYFNEPGGGGTAQALRSFYDQMGSVRSSIDPNRLMMSGTVAPYWVGGEAQFKLIHESPGVDIASMHEYDQDEIASNHTQRCINNGGGKPMIVGEFGINANKTGAGCKTSYADRATKYERKVKAYLNTEGCSGALAWAWQPGGNDSTCGYGTLDRDTAAQAVLKNTNK